MIVPNVRASFGSREIEALLGIFEDRSRRDRRYWERALAREGLDALLDRPELMAAVMESRRASSASAKLTFYVMVRHTLLEAGVEDPWIADYVAALLLEFAVAGRAHRITEHDDKQYHYLVDLVTDLEEENSERRRFLLSAHLGNYSLWLSGLFPDYVIARIHRKGAPGIGYYEGLGSTGYLQAAASEFAGRHHLSRIYREVADGFGAVRRALNHVSDRYFFPVTHTPIDRLLRQAVDDSELN